jgi:Phytanoyl-CoA dioxygenase (PhyH)
MAWLAVKIRRTPDASKMGKRNTRALAAIILRRCKPPGNLCTVRLMDIDIDGYVVVKPVIHPDKIRVLRDMLFASGEAGTRCLLDHDEVRDVAVELRVELARIGLLSKAAVAVQAIAFDKTPGTNWKVTWHQDVMFPFASRATSVGFTLPCVKDGVHYARPPRRVLEEMTAVRLHLDDCDESNGPLRVCPGSHKQGILKSAEIPGHLHRLGEVTCLAREGEVMLMKVLALHASSKAVNPAHRRVLHIVYHSGVPIPEPWHRMV